MHYLHGQGVVHGDLRGVSVPEIEIPVLICFPLRKDNALLENDHICLVDFGLCVYSNGGEGNYMSTRSGNVRWTAPELLAHEKYRREAGQELPAVVSTHRPTKRGDVYSFACVCMEVSEASTTSTGF